jgi:transposase
METEINNTETETNEKKLIYNEIPKQVSRKDFNKYIRPYLTKPKKGPKPKLSLYKIFNYILYVLHTGIQWRQLRTRRNEIHWTNIYKWHNRWSKDGSYLKLFSASVIHLKDTNQLDTSIIHGDGSNTVVKKGALALVTQGTNTRKETRSSPS